MTELYIILLALGWCASSGREDKMSTGAKRRLVAFTIRHGDDGG